MNLSMKLLQVFLLGTAQVFFLSGATYAELEVYDGLTVMSVGLSNDTGGTNPPTNTVIVHLSSLPTECGNGQTGSDCDCGEYSNFVEQNSGEPYDHTLRYSSSGFLFPIDDKDIFKMLWAALNTALSLGNLVNVTIENGFGCNIVGVEVTNVPVVATP